MSNFDFLKNFNEELYERGLKLEEDVIESPRAVTADATMFLETLVKDIYKQTKHKLERKQISFYKKIDYLYRQGEITYIYKNKLQDAYNLRNKIHKNNQNANQEKQLALDIHQRLYYIAKKYFTDYCENERFVNVAEYSTPMKKDIHFKNCIICGKFKTDKLSNMCSECNKKIENANFLLSIKNNVNNDNFTRLDLINSGITESESISLLMDLTKHNIIIKQGNTYKFNDKLFRDYIDEINQYIEINRLITGFYKSEISASKIKKTIEYWKGSINQKPFIEFYNLINIKLEKSFEENLINCENIKTSMKKSEMDHVNVIKWFRKEKEAFKQGSLNDAFILYNEILIDEYFTLKKRGMEDEKIIDQKLIYPELYKFWKSDFMKDDFFKKTNEIKKDIIIKEIRKNRYLSNAIKAAGISRKEFKKIYAISKNSNDSFYNEFKMEYTYKRKKLLIKNLQHNSLTKSLRMSKITMYEFERWYFNSETTLSEFYLKTTEFLMEKYLEFRKNNLNKKDILQKMKISKNIFNSWFKHSDLELFKNFENENKKITQNLVKRGLVINGIKEGKSKQKAILSAGLSLKEFDKIYQTSKREKTDFYQRFDREYDKNRKNLFAQLIKYNDFYNTVEKCKISQIDFNKWYLKDQDNLISNYKASDFYLKTTKELMKKYLKARWNGKNKPDAAKSVGLSNLIIDKWLKHCEIDLYYEFKKKNKQLTIDLIVKGFNEGYCKSEISDIYDIPLKTINEYIELGKVGHIKYSEVYELFENTILPNQIETFLNNFKTKSFKKSLKQSKLTKDELNFYYKLGASGNEKFKDFHQKLLDLKIELYVKYILQKKSSKIALKNSNLHKSEFKRYKSKIEDMIYNGRLKIIADNLLKYNPTGAKLANAAGISVEEIYDWYFKGKNNDEKYKEFYIMFELTVIVPRVELYKKSLIMGISKNWLLKKLRKNLGSQDFSIWKKHDILNSVYIEKIKIDENNVDIERLINFFKNFNFSQVIDKKDDPEAFNIIKKSVIDSEISSYVVKIVGK